MYSSENLDHFSPFDNMKTCFQIVKRRKNINRFYFTHNRIEAHICICFVVLKVYKELERMLKVTEVKMSIDKVFALQIL